MGRKTKKQIEFLNFTKKLTKNYFSQNGEDGFIEGILSRIPEKDFSCVEFGAWDGQHLSNTYHLIAEKNYKGVLIEGVKEKFIDLKKNMSKFNTTCLNRWVDYKSSSVDSLDNILSETDLAKNFDLLSIDIDGNDYHIWNSLKNYIPKIVIIEINYRLMPDVEEINEPDSPVVNGKSGSSIKSLTNLGIDKGYTLIGNVGCNAIFIHNDYSHIFIDKPFAIEDLYTYEGVKIKYLNLMQFLKMFKSKMRKQYFKIKKLASKNLFKNN